MRMFSGYKVLYRVGAGVDQVFDRDREADYHALAGCVLCFPVLKSTGEFHACPFAVESDAPHYRLGDARHAARGGLRELPALPDLGAPPCSIPPRATAGITSCEMCQRHVTELPTYHDRR